MGEMNRDSVTLTARYVFPVAGPPLEHGLLSIEGDRIVAVESHGARAADFDCGDVAIIPGLVNAHTHLDLTGSLRPGAAVGRLHRVGCTACHRNTADRSPQTEQ